MSAPEWNAERDAALATLVQKHGQLTVACTGHRGRRYRVVFSDKASGGAELVESAYRRGRDTGTVFRTIWTWTSGRPMTKSVVCAVHAAREVALARCKGGAL